MARLRLRMACWGAIPIALLATVIGVAAPAASAQEPCSNADLRAQQDATGLPDCRAYEMVSPLDKDGYGIINEAAQVSVEGDAIIYPSIGAFSGPQGGDAISTYLARRGPQGWATRNLTPPRDPEWFLALTQYVAFSDDLSIGALQARTPPQLPGAEEAPLDTLNLFLRDTSANSYDLVSTLPPPPDPFGFGTALDFSGASGDWSRVIFFGYGEFLPGGALNVYEWAQGQPLRLAGILPNGDVAPTADPGAGVSKNLHNAISEDGSRIFFTSPASGQNIPEGQLYMRVGGTDTIHVSEPQRPINGPDPAGTKPAYFFGASADGSVVYFTSCEKLTDDATAASESGVCNVAAPEGGNQLDGSDLYRYDVASGELTDLTVADPTGAKVLGAAGISESGDRVYFAAHGVLAPGATAGQPNLYLWDASTGSPEIEFVAPLAPGERGNWLAPEAAGRSTFRMTSDGSRVAFQTAASVPGHDGGGLDQVYLYDAISGELDCASCSPGGGATPGAGMLIRQQRSVTISRWKLSTNLGSDGSRLYFESASPLDPRDSNGRIDVYEYDAASGNVTLITSGRGAADAGFVGTSPDGRDVFFTTSEGLVGWDDDVLVDLYSARVGGGFPEPVSTPPACAGDACQGAPPGGPPLRSPASDGASGARNADPGPRARLSVAKPSARQRAALAQRGRTTLVARVNRAGRLAIVARARIGGRTLRVGSASKRVAKAGRVRLGLRLSRQARQRLAAGRTLKVTLTTRFTGVSDAQRLTIDLRRTK